MRTRHVAVVASVVLVFAAVAAETAILTDSYAAPVVSRGTGKGGTIWKTEICVTNPWEYSLTLTDAFVQGGGVVDGTRWELPAGNTECSQDAVSDWLGRSSWTGAYVITALEEDNPGVDTLFAVSVKIYNTDPRGTFGQTVPMGSYIPDPWGVAYPLSYGVATGIQNYGAVGVSGFRTNLGVFNPADVAQEFEFHVYGNEGQELWSTTRNVPAMSQIQFAIPAGVVVQNGALLGVIHGDWFMFGYASTADNRSGDGVYKPLSVEYSIQKRLQAKAQGVTVGPRDALVRLLGSATGIERLDGPRSGRTSPHD